jgi:hypothetical protein
MAERFCRSKAKQVVQGVSPCLREFLKRVSASAQGRVDRPTLNRRRSQLVLGSDRVNRGAIRNNDVANCRTANRKTKDRTNRPNNNGFRLAVNSAGKEVIALRLQTEQIVFQSEQVLA